MNFSIITTTFTGLEEYKKITKDTKYILVTEELFETFDYSSYKNYSLIAFFVEPFCINGRFYKKYKEYDHHFDYILCTNVDFLMNFEKEKRLWLPFSNTWIYEKDQKLYKNKTKICSTITSYKDWTTYHKKRNHISDLIIDNHLNVDIRGTYRNLKPIDRDERIHMFKDYMFHICVENCCEDLFFSEKILDCFLTGVVPIHLGAKKEYLEKLFDVRGIIFLDDYKTDKEIINLLNSLTDETYKKYTPYLETNYKIAKKICPIDKMIIKILKTLDK